MNQTVSTLQQLGIKETKIISLHTVEIKQGYAAHHIRPYSVHVTPQVIDNLVHATVSGGLRNINPSIITARAPEIVQLSPAGIVAPIVNGWGQPRMSFELVAHMVTTNGPDFIYKVHGYTDILDVSATSINPDTAFYINSVDTIRLSTNMAGGNAQYLADSSQYLFGQQGNTEELVLQRPADVFAQNQHNYSNPYNDMVSSRSINGGAFEFEDLTSNIGVGGRSSSRDDLSGNRWLSNIIKTTGDAAMYLSPDMTEEDRVASTYTQAVTMTAHDSIYENMFIRHLFNGTNNAHVGAVFTYNDLLRLDPSVGGRHTHSFNIASNESENHNAGTPESLIAATVSTSLSAILSGRGLSGIECAFTNMTFNSQPTCTITNMYSIIPNQPNSIEEDIKRYIILELIPTITRGGLILLSVTVNGSINGNLNVNVSVEGSTPTPFAYASFADATHPPVLSDRGIADVVNATGCFIDSILMDEQLELRNGYNLTTVNSGHTY